MAMPALQRKLAILVTALLIAGCDSGEPDPGSAADQPEMQPAADASTADSDGPGITFHLTDMDEFGEVAGLTTSKEEFLDLTLILRDEDGDPVSNEELEISSLVGNEVSDTTVTTDGDGKAEMRLRPILPGEDTLTITGNGTSNQLTVYVTDEAYGHPIDHMEERATELPESDDTVSWDLIGGVDTREGSNGLLEPLFDDEIRELDGREVKVQGFMMPLDNSERQQHFLVTRTPPSCFYCLPGGPESVVEVKAERPLEFTFDPVVLEGRMTLLEGSDMGLFYRLEDASVESK